MISMLTASGSQDWKGKFKIFINFYEDDLPNPLALDGELIRSLAILLGNISWFKAL